MDIWAASVSWLMGTKLQWTRVDTYAWSTYAWYQLLWVYAPGVVQTDPMVVLFSFFWNYFWSGCTSCSQSQWWCLPVSYTDFVLRRPWQLQLLYWVWSKLDLQFTPDARSVPERTLTQSSAGQQLSKAFINSFLADKVIWTTFPQQRQRHSYLSTVRVPLMCEDNWRRQRKSCQYHPTQLQTAWDERTGDSENGEGRSPDLEPGPSLIVVQARAHKAQRYIVSPEFAL